ncbi:hypothetical protein FACS189427_10010 [Planctomycetales bacterium]|nr:hypothetical protein FACS189427_10010 [Planctomycetales bacterium]
MRLHLIPFIFAAMLALSPALVQANTNQQAAEKIAASLGDRFPGYDIAVSYQNGKVQLVGEVATVDMVQNALEQARRVPGVNVTEIDNGLRVKGNSAAPVKAEKVTAVNNPAPKQEPKQEKARHSIFSPQPAKPAQLATAPVPMPQKAVVVQAAAQQQAQQAAPQPAPQLIQTGQQPPQLIPYGAGTHGAIPPQGAYHHHPEAYQQVPPQGGYCPEAYQQVPPQGAYHPEAYGPQGPLPGQYNSPNLPAYAWPSYAAYPNYAEVSYPRQYSPKAWPYVGPFYPYPQAPLGWRKVAMEWHDGWWWLDFDDGSPTGPFSPLFRQPVRYTY